MVEPRLMDMLELPDETAPVTSKQREETAKLWNTLLSRLPIDRHLQGGC